MCTIINDARVSDSEKENWKRKKNIDL
jgi:hypothetical protein